MESSHLAYMHDNCNFMPASISTNTSDHQTTTATNSIATNEMSQVASGHYHASYDSFISTGNTNLNGSQISSGNALHVGRYYHYNNGHSNGCWPEIMHSNTANSINAIGEEFTLLKTNENNNSFLVSTSSSYSSINNQQNTLKYNNQEHGHSHHEMMSSSIIDSNGYSHQHYQPLSYSSSSPTYSNGSTYNSVSMFSIPNNQLQQRNIRYMPPTPPNSEPGSPSNQQSSASSSSSTNRHIPNKSQTLVHGIVNNNEKLTNNIAHFSRVSSISSSLSSSSSSSTSPLSVSPPPPPVTSTSSSSSCSPSSSLHLKSTNNCTSGGTVVPFISHHHSQQQCNNNGNSVKVSHSHSSNLFGTVSRVSSSSSLTSSSSTSTYNNGSIVAQVTPAVVATAVTQPRYNRRNNPELEKRRIHRCDYSG